MLAIVIVLIFALATQNWLNISEGASLLQANDVNGYLAMSRAAPHLATGVQFEHAQRLLPHWLIGSFSSWTGAPIERVYEVAVGLCILGILTSLFKTMEKIRTPVQIRTVLLSAFLLNPYALRFYLILPPMISDLVFVLGIALLLQGFASRRFTLVLVGVVVGAIGRQNMLLLIPGVIAGLFFSQAFNNRNLTTRSLFAALTLMTIATLSYETGQIAHLFALPSFATLALMTSVIPWLSSPEFEKKALIEHITRCFFPLLTPLMIFFASLTFPSFRKRIWTIECLMLFLMIGGLMAAALLPSPVFQAQSQSRYAGFALVPSLALVAWLWGTKEDVGNLIPVGFSWALIWTALGVSSLHHLYTRIGPTTVVQFTVMTLVSCAVIFGTFLKLFQSYKLQVANNRAKLETTH